MDKILDISIVKLTNYRTVWGYIHKKKSVTIPQISKAIGLSLPTVTRAVEYGIKEGIIESVGISSPERGRKAQVYSLRADYMHFILIYIDSEKLRFVVHDFLSRDIKHGEVPVNNDNVLRILEEVSVSLCESDVLISMISIAFSGVMHKGTVIDSAAYRSLNGVNLINAVGKRTGKLVLADNDLHITALAAPTYKGHIKDETTLLFAFGKTASGIGITICDYVIHGAGGAAGETGNIPTLSEDVAEKRTEFCAERLQAAIALLNPKRIIMYELDGTVFSSDIEAVLAKNLKPYILPEFVKGRDFSKDCFIGLSLACEKEIKRNLKERLDL